MPNYDFRSPRLFVEAPLGQGAEVRLNAAQAHYLGAVLRLKSGGRVLVFNGRDGEWEGSLAAAKRVAFVRVAEQARAQSAATDLYYLFAPLKVARVNIERMRANAIEAAEQCGVLSLPKVDEPVALSRLLAEWDPVRRLIF